MDQVFVIGYREVALLGGLVTFVVSVVGSVVVWFMNGRFDQIDRALAEMTARMDRAIAEFKDQNVRGKAEQTARMDRDKAEVMDRIDHVKAEVTVLVKESEERSEERWRAAGAQADKREARDEERWRAASARADKQEARDEERHREIQAALREVNYRVGRLEGAIGASAGPAPDPDGTPRGRLTSRRGRRTARWWS